MPRSSSSFCTAFSIFVLLKAPLDIIRRWIISSDLAFLQGRDLMIFILRARKALFFHTLLKSATALIRYNGLRHCFFIAAELMTDIFLLYSGSVHRDVILFDAQRDTRLLYAGSRHLFSHSFERRRIISFLYAEQDH